MIIDITMEGVFRFESKETSLLEIERIAAAGIANQGESGVFDVLIRPDRNAPVAHLDRLLLRISNVGVQKWKLATVEADGGAS